MPCLHRLDASVYALQFGSRSPSPRNSPSIRVSGRIGDQMVDVPRMYQIRIGFVQRGDANISHGTFQFIAHNLFLCVSFLDDPPQTRINLLSIKCSTPSCP